MKRILLVLTVALVMAAMVATSAMPAFARSYPVNTHSYNACTKPPVAHAWYCP